VRIENPDWNAVEVSTVNEAGSGCNKHCLADGAIHSCVVDVLNFEDWVLSSHLDLSWVRLWGKTLHEAQVKDLFALEVALLVPLDDGVFELTDPIQVAVDLLGAVAEEEALRPVFVVGECSHLGSLRECGWFPLEPLDETGKVGKGDRELDGVALAYQLDWLSVYLLGL
jgi:hypothetical protein